MRVAWRLAPFVCGVLIAALVSWMSPWTAADWQFWSVVVGVALVVGAAGATAEGRWRP